MPPGAFIVRPARTGDGPHLAALVEALGYATAPQQTSRRLEALLGHRDNAVFVAEREGRVVGWIHATAQLSLVGEPGGLIAGLVVDEGSRRGGVGRALVERAEAWFGELGLRLARVRSRDSRLAAHAFYGRLGYERSKTQVLFRRGL